MRKHFIIFRWLFAISGPVLLSGCFAQTAYIAKCPLRLSVRPVGSENRGKPYVSVMVYMTDVTRSYYCNVRIQNISDRHLKNVQVRWAYLARPDSGNHERTIIRGERRLDIKPYGVQNIDTDMATLRGFIESLFIIRVSRVPTFLGYYIEVLVDGEVAATASKPPGIEKHIQTTGGYK